MDLWRHWSGRECHVNSRVQQRATCIEASRFALQVLQQLSQLAAATADPHVHFIQFSRSCKRGAHVRARLHLVQDQRSRSCLGKKDKTFA